jgi:hypothetical protein
VPQDPQWEALDVTSTQELPHAVCPDAQLEAQRPLEHTCPFEHALPQAPQLLPSDVGSTQPDEHVVSPG